MPVVPNPLVYVALKAGGYALYAKAANTQAGSQVSPLAFGAAKIALGFGTGLLYLFVLDALRPPEFHKTTWLVFVCFAPLRILSWGIAVALFFRSSTSRTMRGYLVVAGVVWSYILDGVMWLLYRFIPGAAFPFC
jgi:hypothetical protein